MAQFLGGASRDYRTRAADVAGFCASRRALSASGVERGVIRNGKKAWNKRHDQCGALPWTLAQLLRLASAMMRFYAISLTLLSCLASACANPRGACDSVNVPSPASNYALGNRSGQSTALIAPPFTHAAGPADALYCCNRKAPQNPCRNVSDYDCASLPVVKQMDFEDAAFSDHDGSWCVAWVADDQIVARAWVVFD